MAVRGAHAVKGHHQPFRGQAKGAGARPAPMQLRTLILFSAIPSYHGTVCVGHTLRELLCAYGACSCVANVLIGAKDDVAAYSDAAQALASGLNARYQAVQPAVRISIRAPPHGRRHPYTDKLPLGQPFHPMPRAGEGTPCCGHGFPANRYFNPRLPHGRRRARRGHLPAGQLISTHASHTGGDYSRKSDPPVAALFQPTPPAREATQYCAMR